MKFVAKKSMTNLIRFFLDECLPPIVRDNKYFMFPLYYIYFKGKNVLKIMNWKSYFNTLTENEYVEFYKNVSLGIMYRETDVNQNSLNFILSNIGEDKEQSILDVGCGRGFFLKQMKSRGYKYIAGCDIIESSDLAGIKYFKCNIDNPVFKDKEFDIVNCSHTLEHVIDIDKAMRELIRVAKKKIIITAPLSEIFSLHFGSSPAFLSGEGVFRTKNEN